MDGYQFFLLMLAGYISLLIITGFYFNRRQVSISDFLLAGRTAGPLAIGCSAAASWLTAGALLAVTGFFMLLGMGSIWGFVAPNILALLGIALLVGKIRSIPAMTQPEMLEMRYGATLRAPVALIITVVMILFAVADIKGFGLVLQVFYGIGNVQAAIIVGVSVAVYVTLGGLSAVLATDMVQFICLSAFILVMAMLVMMGAGDATGMAGADILVAAGGDWWNPMSIGLPMVLIFSLAILPGWLTEQDPWQKIWAAKDSSSARKGFVFGALLVTIVFGGCAVIAVGLQKIYPGIGKLGFPMGMGQAEAALLNFIMDSGWSDMAVALCAVALATAAMSCADTFAASGASCISRDIYQRYINPDATMKQMMVVNRLSVFVILGCAVAGSFFITSIIDAIHIATFIASASYFFALMGGMYWRRGTEAGAKASMVTGFVSQCGLVAIDLGMTQPGGQPFLESLHPLMMGHGVIAAMFMSGAIYILVSLITAPAATFRLAPFFRDQAELLAESAEEAGKVARELPADLVVLERNSEGRVHLRINIDIPETIAWNSFVARIAEILPFWQVFAGRDSIRRITKADLNSTVLLVRGESKGTAWLEVEGSIDIGRELHDDLAAAYHEVSGVLQGSAAEMVTEVN